MEVNIRLATDDDVHLPTFDHTKLAAINTCPTFGLIRYEHHKTLTQETRALALEAGQACHDVFAAVRLYQLMHQKREDGSTMEALAEYHMGRLFSTVRVDEMMSALARTRQEDQRTQMMNFALTALETSGFYDDPRDKNRTLTNLEDSCIAYMDNEVNFDRPVWVRDESNPESDVGIEVPFALVIEFTETPHDFALRLVGRIDGIHWTSPKKEEIEVQENKSAARLNEAWSCSFDISHQVSTYTVAALVHVLGHINFEFPRTRVLGNAIPLPKNSRTLGTTSLIQARGMHQISRWLDWIAHTYDVWERFKDTPLTAPLYSHSCNRFFRPCQMIPLCAAPLEERAQIFEEMRYDKWSPLDE